MSNKPTVVILIDKSTSMRDHDTTVRDGLEPLVNDRDLNSKADLLGAIFGSHCSAVGKLVNYYNTWADQGSTHLYEAAISTLDQMQRMKGAADPVLVIMITDGDDTTKQTPDNCKATVEHAEEILTWDFLFVGTNQNAYETGKLMGVKTGKTLSFDNTTGGFEAMLQSLQRIVPDWVAGNIGHEEEFFTKDDKKKHKASANSFDI